jgi:peptidoglycan/LPS O-acetylase OafA/YrhL
MAQFITLFVLVVSDRYYLSAILSWGPLRWVGKISYSVYLLHYFVLLSLLSWLPSSGSYLIGFSLVLAVTLLVSWLSYKFVERPLQRVVLALLKSSKYSERLSESGRI